MSTISKRDLERLVERINEVTGSPMTPYKAREDGHPHEAQIGNYHLSYAYGGVALHRMSNESGGVRDIFGSHMPKRELYWRMQSYLLGLSKVKT